MGGQMPYRIGRHVGVQMDAGKFLASVAIDTRLPSDVRAHAMRIWEAGIRERTFRMDDLHDRWNVREDGTVWDGITPED